MGARPTVRVTGAGRHVEQAREVLARAHMLHRSTTDSHQHTELTGPDLALVVVDEPTEVMDALATAAADMPDAKLVVMTTLGGPDALISAVAAGADGWLMPAACDNGLGAVLADIVRGQSGFSRSDTALLVQALRRQLTSDTQPDSEPLDGRAALLTPRQREILDALEQGRSTREVAEALSLSEVTVRWHASQAKKKLALGSGAPDRPVRPATRADDVAADPSDDPVPESPAMRSVASGKGLGRAEMRVALLVAEGLSNKQIADQLFISRHTVESHLKQTFVKLGVRSRVDLTRVILASASETG
jgi:DNA-binding NarL/FixJ family response regulator